MQVPTSITNLNVAGILFSSYLTAHWPDFYVFNHFSGHKIMVPEHIRLSLCHTRKVKKIIQKPFFVHIYISQNGLLTLVNQQNENVMLDSY